MSAATAVAPASEVRPAWSDEETLKHVRPEVRALLEASPSFNSMSPAERRDLASLMVKVCAYMVNPEGTTTEALADGAPPEPLAEAQADPVGATQERLSKAPGFAGKDFQGGAIRQGTEQFGELVKKVDFPAFVAGLINGVFKAIVDTSIQQMRAYGELLANVAKTVDQFAQDNITENNTRDWLAQKYPDDLEISTAGMEESFADTGDGSAAPAPTPKLVVKADDQEAALKKISEDLRLEKPLTDLSEEMQEHQLITKAKLEIAKSRQQLLASMVMLGINRIVVTDGLIHAKVVFDMKASDQAKRVAKASMYDRAEQSASVTTEASFGGWFSPFSASTTATASSDHVTTVESSVDETSESKAALKANLTGEVRVNFKSDYFPMDKLANPQMIAAIQGNAVPPERPPGAPAAPAPAPAAPAAQPARAPAARA